MSANVKFLSLGLFSRAFSAGFLTKSITLDFIEALRVAMGISFRWLDGGIGIADTRKIYRVTIHILGS
jgi:hypothetical protein